VIEVDELDRCDRLDPSRVVLTPTRLKKALSHPLVKFDELAYFSRVSDEAASARRASSNHGAPSGQG